MNDQQAADMVAASQAAAQYTADISLSTHDLVAYAALQAFDQRVLIGVLIVALLIIIGILVRGHA